MLKAKIFPPSTWPTSVTPNSAYAKLFSVRAAKPSVTITHIAYSSKRQMPFSLVIVLRPWKVSHFPSGDHLACWEIQVSGVNGP